MYKLLWAVLLLFTIMWVVIVFWFDAPLRVRISSGICQILFALTTIEIIKKS